MHRNRAFTLTEMFTAIVVCGLILIYSYSMIGCGDSGGGKAMNDDLKKAADDLRATAGELKETAEKLDAATKTLEPFAQSLKLRREATGMRGNARQMMNSTQVRGIHSGCILWAQGNKDYYPGIDSNGQHATSSVAASPGIYGFGTPDGKLVAYRMAVLLRGNFFSPEYMRSPADTNKAITTPVTGTNFADGAAYSYAMLNISNLQHPRTGEWRATNNSRAAVISDRNIGSGATGTTAQSVHAKAGEGWRGSVVWNDNHATFETTDVMRTEYSLKGDVTQDQLFSDRQIAGEGDRAIANADAAMVFKAGDSYVNQQP